MHILIKGLSDHRHGWKLVFYWDSNLITTTENESAHADL